MEIEDDFIKQEANTPSVIKEERFDQRMNKQPQDTVPRTNVIVIRRAPPASVVAQPTPVSNNAAMLMPPPLTMLRKNTGPGKAFTRITSNAKKTSPRLTHDRRKVVAQERTADIMNRMANSLSTMAKTLPLLTQEIGKLRAELVALQNKNK